MKWVDHHELWVGKELDSVMMYFRMLSLRLLGETEEDHRDPHSGHPVIRPRFEPITS